MAQESRSVIARAIVDDIAAGKKPDAQAIASYLLQTGGTAGLQPLMRDVMQLRMQQGIVEVVAVTAHALTDANKHDIETQVRALHPNAKQIIIAEQIDASMIGGIRLDFPDAQLDSTVHHSLRTLKQLTA